MMTHRSLAVLRHLRALAVFGVALLNVAVPNAAAGGGRLQGGVEVSLSAAEEVTLGEPIVAVFRLTNRSSATISFDMGEDRLTSFRFDVTTPGGSKLAVRPTSGALGEIMVDAKLRPGESYRQTIVLSQWVQFTQPGPYVIRAVFEGLIAPAHAAPGAAAREQTLRITVLPADESRLQARCTELLRLVVESASNEDARVAVIALAHVPHPIVVPFLVKVVQAGRWTATAIDGIARVGSDEARTALELLAKDANPNVARLAADALRRIRTSRNNPLCGRHR